MSLPAVDKLGAVFRGADLEASLSMLAVNMAAKVRLWRSCVSNVPPVLITGHVACLSTVPQQIACLQSLPAIWLSDSHTPCAQYQIGLR